MRTHPGCVLLPSGSDATRRQVIFDETSDGITPVFDPKANYDPKGDGSGGFALGSRVVTGPVGEETVLPGRELKPVPYGLAGPMHSAHGMTMDALPTIPRACAVLGRGEVWELVNWTTGTHNFHIHQGKFRLAAAGDPGVPAGLAQPIIADPKTEIAAYLSRIAAGGDVQAWHNTLPVPPRLDPAHPGRVFVFIPFEAPEQAGSFVFHCHILEHEDRGMMADVEVVRPVGAHRKRGS